MQRLLSVLFILVLILSSSALGFDGNRKGLVIGGGIGVAYASNDRNEYYASELSGPGGAAHFLIGGAVDNRTILGLEVNGVIFNDLDGSYTVYQTFVGAVWYEYFDWAGDPFFITLGLGTGVAKRSNKAEQGSGVTGLFAVGRILVDHIQLGMYGSLNLTSPEGRSQYQLSLLFSFMAY